MKAGFVLLEDGTRFDGEVCGAVRPVTGEVVFNTAMSGYQEAVTDPSYAGQIITFTAPHVGNYGVSAEAMESDRIHARAVIMRAAVNREDAPGAERGWLDWLQDCDVPAITGVDTRALVRHIRDRGAMRGGVFPDSVPEAEARALVEAEPSMTGRDLAKEVSPREPILLEPLSGPDRGLADRDRGDRGLGDHGLGDHGRGRDPAPDGVGPRIVAIDTGIKTSIVTNLRKRGAFVELHPCSATSEELLARDADAYFLANGPGDPAALDHIVDTVRDLVGKRPVFGICLGHQLLCRAVGLETFKLPFGHRGSNHPVKDLTTGRIEITSQNHGFAVLGPEGERTMDTDDPVRWETDFGAAELTHLNLYDRTVEGLTLLDVPGSTVQYHPEAGPGPHDALYLFDRFLEAIRAAA